MLRKYKVATLILVIQHFSVTKTVAMSVFKLRTEKYNSQLLLLYKPTFRGLCTYFMAILVYLWLKHFVKVRF
jgi:hypothetical protein